jgi:hypothetical protein
MIARFSGAVLGLLAFGVSTLAGVLSGNPATVVLSRAIWSLIVFCVIGLLVGFAAQAVIHEHENRRKRELFGDEDGGDIPPAKADNSTSSGAKPMGT